MKTGSTTLRASMFGTGRGLLSVASVTFALLVAAAAGVPAARAAAQATDDAPRGLRLHEALEQALRSSPRLAAVRDALDRATISHRLAESRFGYKITPFFSTLADPYGPTGPSFGVDLQKLLPTGTTVGFRANSFAFGGGAGGGRDNGYTFSVSHPIFAAFGPEPEYELTVAGRAVENAAGEIEATRQRLVLEVAQAYFDIVRQQNLLAASEVALERARRLKIASETRMSVGLATRLDVLRADLFRSQTEASLGDRQTALADAEDHLKLLMGLPVNAPLRIAGDDLDDYVGGAEIAAADPSAPESLRPLIAVALSERVDVRLARARVEDAEHAASLATWSLLPKINLNASYSQRGLGSAFGSAYADLFRGWNIGITSAYTLDRSAEMAAFNSASISARSAERALADLRERVAADVRRAHRAILRAEKSIDIQTQAVEVSETQLELAQLRYERGLADNFDVVDAESNLFNAQSALVSARVDRAIAGLALELSMGRLSPGKYSR
ncbi:MAG TPA: TolC family protein [Acidobacteriota bacterium]